MFTYSTRQSMTRRKIKRGGNVRSGRQLLYIMQDAGTNDLKIGISNSPNLRAAQVSEGNQKGGQTEVVAHWWFLNAHRVEQFLHRAFSWMNRPRSGDGGTEWFDPDAAIWMMLCICAGAVLNVFTRGGISASDQSTYFWTCIIAPVVFRALLFRLVLCGLIWVLWGVEKGVIVVVVVLVVIFVFWI